jgi:hypothetical protein
MGGIVKKIKGVFSRADKLAPIPGAGQTSRQATGIASGRRGQPEEARQNRRPGRRGTDTPLGPGRQRL